MRVCFASVRFPVATTVLYKTAYLIKMHLPFHWLYWILGVIANKSGSVDIVFLFCVVRQNQCDAATIMIAIGVWDDDWIVLLCAAKAMAVRSPYSYDRSVGCGLDCEGFMGKA